MREIGKRNPLKHETHREWCAGLARYSIQMFFGTPPNYLPADVKSDVLRALEYLEDLTASSPARADDFGAINRMVEALARASALYARHRNREFAKRVEAPPTPLGNYMVLREIAPERVSALCAT